MKHKTIYNVAICAAALALSLTSCVKDELFDTPHPDKGAVVVTADFSQRSEACPCPAEYTLAIGGESCTAPAEQEHCHPTLFAPGAHPLIAYNACEKMTVSNGQIQVNTRPDGTIEPLPGYLFTARQEITVVQDDTLRIDLPMAQRTRDLHFELTVTEGNPELIRSVTATLSGIAGAFDLDAQQTTGEATATGIAFTRNAGKLTADARLLGTLDTMQTLTLEIAFTDRAEIQTTAVDLTEALAGFNGTMTVGFEIKGDVETPIGMDATATITGWNDVMGDPVEAI